MANSRRTLLEHTTSLSPADVLEAARRFFPRRNSLYAAFPEQQSDQHLTFRGQGGEELVIAVEPVPNGTRVTCSTYFFDMQIGRFFSVLPPLAGAPV
ncbi:MAG TPA: hypothetical protein VF178_03215 [Gemmatimonadaceae bacterium]